MIVIMRKEKSTKVCRRIEVNHFDGLLKKKANIAFVQNHMNSPTYFNWIWEQIRCRARCKRYLYFSRVQCHRSHYRTFLKTTHLSRDNILLMNWWDTLTWFQLYWDIECYIWIRESENIIELNQIEKLLLFLIDNLIFNIYIYIYVCFYEIILIIIFFNQKYSKIQYKENC